MAPTKTKSPLFVLRSSSLDHREIHRPLACTTARSRRDSQRYHREQGKVDAPSKVQTHGTLGWGSTSNDHEQHREQNNTRTDTGIRCTSGRNQLTELAAHAYLTLPLKKQTKKGTRTAPPAGGTGVSKQQIKPSTNAKTFRQVPAKKKRSHFYSRRLFLNQRQRT